MASSTLPARMMPRTGPKHSVRWSSLVGATPSRCQRFLAEQGDAYRIVDAEGVLGEPDV